MGDAVLNSDGTLPPLIDQGTMPSSILGGLLTFGGPKRSAWGQMPMRLRHDVEARLRALRKGRSSSRRRRSPALRRPRVPTPKRVLRPVDGRGARARHPERTGQRPRADERDPRVELRVREVLGRRPRRSQRRRRPRPAPGRLHVDGGAGRSRRLHGRRRLQGRARPAPRRQQLGRRRLPRRRRLGRGRHAQRAFGGQYRGDNNFIQSAEDWCVLDLKRVA